MRYKVDELAQAAGITVDTVRYYQNKGLLAPPAREGRNAIYDESHLARLQRIYGTAWASKKDLKAHLHRLEEAKKRDHRKLGTDLDMFSFPDVIGSGLPVWHPNGGLVRKIMEDHNGEVVLENRDEGGARVSLVFHPTRQADDAETDAGEEDDSTTPDPMEVATRILIDGP